MKAARKIDESSSLSSNNPNKHVGLIGGVALSALLFIHCARTPEISLSVNNRGANERAVTLAQLQSHLTRQTVTVFEPHERRTRQFAGFKITDVLNDVYGDAWKQVDEVIFRCIDGYEIAFTRQEINQREGYLAFASADTSEFTITHTGHGDSSTALAPFYVIWRGESSPTSGEARDWPYQVNAIDLALLRDRYVHSNPPTSATEIEQRGFRLFRRHCSTCHAVNGEGGSTGPELNVPVSVTEYIQPAWLVRIIRAPSEVRRNAKMPAYTADGRNSDEEISAIIEYLKLMAQHQVR